MTHAENQGQQTAVHWVRTGSIYIENRYLAQQERGESGDGLKP